jgi:hypothetical protein
LVFTPSKKPVTFPNEKLELIVVPIVHRSDDPVLRHGGFP